MDESDKEIADEVRALKGYAKWYHQSCINAEASGRIP